MKKFIRENPTLAFGLALPLIIVAAFLLASELSDLGAIPPKHSVVFATNYYANNNTIRFNVEGGKAHVVAIGENGYPNLPKLFVFNPTTHEVHEIRITLPPELIRSPSRPCCQPPGDNKPEKLTPISVPELEALTLDTSYVSPDGYEFSGYDTYAHEPMDLFFFSNSYRSGAVLKKGGHKVHVPQVEGEYYGYNPFFIGWVVSP